jgi:hypothetical protein
MVANQHEKGYYKMWQSKEMIARIEGIAAGIKDGSYL